MRFRRDEGSIFIETMIAAAIVAVMLGGLFQAMAASAVRHRMSEDRRTALLIAQSQIAQVGAAVSLQSGRTATLQGDYVSQVDVDAYPGMGGDSAAGRLAMVVVTVHRRDGARSLVTLRTLRLASAGS